jgi:hypothetical protein
VSGVRYTVQTAVTFDNSQPQYLLVEWCAGGDDTPHCVGQHFTIEDAIKHAHERMNTRPHLTVIENPRKRKLQPEG